MGKHWISSALHYFIYLFGLSYLIGSFSLVFAEENTVTYKADRLENEMVNNKVCKKLEGNAVVTFQPSGVILTADKVYKYDEQDLIEAQGQVKIVDKEGIVIQADQLAYYTQRKLALLEKNVKCVSQKGNFYTPKLSYNVETKQGEFWEGGKLEQGKMVLTSSRGVYEGAAKKITFSKKVELVDLAYTLHCDQLCYDTELEQATFQGETTLLYHGENKDSPGERAFLSNRGGGTYLLSKQHLVFNNGTLTTKDIILTADCIEVLNEADCVATGHVSVQAKAHGAVIEGEQAKYFEKEKKTEITGNPLLTKTINDKEVIYLRADTFVAIEKPLKEGEPLQELHALHNVRLYQEKFQGLADGAIYNSAEKTIRFQNKPIVWCSGYQITGEEAYLVIEKEEEIKMFIDKNLFMVSADPVGNFNQIKGNKMIASFKDRTIEKMFIQGDSESLYFVLGEKNELAGMNHIQCTDIEITLMNNELERMECKPKPIGKFYPVDLIEEDKIKLHDFEWEEGKMPTKENMLSGGDSSLPPLLPPQVPSPAEEEGPK